jgi:hypothetical protein
MARDDLVSLDPTKVSLTPRGRELAEDITRLVHSEMIPGRRLRVAENSAYTGVMVVERDGQRVPQLLPVPHHRLTQRCL